MVSKYGRATFYVEKLKKKLRGSRQRTRDKASRHDRQTAAALCKLKKDAIWNDVKLEWKRQEDVAHTLAVKHSKKVEWMRRQIQNLSSYGPQKRAVNRWNAYVHVKSLEINEGLAPGKKKRLQELQQLTKDNSSWKTIPKEDMDAMVRCVEEMRLLKKTGHRSQPAAHMQDVRQTTKRVEEELRSLGARCKTSSMTVTVRTGSNQGNNPIYANDETSRAFVEVVLGMHFEEFCLKYEAFAMAGLKGVAKNDNERRCMLKRRVRALVRRGLQEITGRPDIEMKWASYEDALVNEYSVVLEGWPATVFDPGALGTKELEKVIATLEDGSCAWRQLSNDELKKRQADITAKIAAGDVTVRKRKKRSDAGSKRGSYKQKKKAISEGSEGEINDEDVSSMQRVVSSETIEDSDS